MTNSTLIKFPDDVTVIGLIISDDESDNHILIFNIIHILNVDKTKKMIVDFRKCINLNDSIILNGNKWRTSR